MTHYYNMHALTVLMKAQTASHTDYCLSGTHPIKHSPSSPAAVGGQRLGQPVEAVLLHLLARDRTRVAQPHAHGAARRERCDHARVEAVLAPVESTTCATETAGSYSQRAP